VDELWRIMAPHFVAGVTVRDGVIVRAAPILAWTRGKELRRLLNYASSKGWVVERRCEWSRKSIPK